MTKRIFGKHGGHSLTGAAAVAVFPVCARMLTVGRGDAVGEWQGASLMTLAAFGVALLVIPVLAVAADSVFDESAGHTKMSRAVRWAILLSAAAFSVYVAFITVGRSADFAEKAVGIDTGRVPIAAIMLGAGAYIASLGSRAVKKLALVSLAVTVVSSLILLCLSVASGGEKADGVMSLISREAFGRASDLNGIIDTVLRVISPAVVAVIWLSASEKDSNEKRAATRATMGIALGGGVLLLCLLTVISTLGLPYASTRDYPYLSSVGSMTAGKLFMRPEGLVYISYLWSALTSVSVCLSAASLTVRGKGNRYFPCAVAAVLLVIYIFLG